MLEHVYIVIVVILSKKCVLFTFHLACDYKQHNR